MAASSACVPAGDEPEAPSSLIWIGAVPGVAIQFFGGGAAKWGGLSRKNYCKRKEASGATKNDLGMDLRNVFGTNVG